MTSFSIITAVFNGQDYITKCVESIAKSNYDLNLIEHIIVDDGSTDNTKKICEELSKKYSHIKFYSKNNGNWGSVINYVKKNNLAHNDYIVLCDADDVMLPNCFKIANKKNDNADLFVSSFYRWNGKKGKIKILPYFFFKRHLKKHRPTQFYSSIVCPQSCWMKKNLFYSLDDLQEGVAYQDIVLFMHAQLNASLIRWTSKPTSLYWCKRPGNSMTSTNEEKGLLKLLNNFYIYEKNGWIEPFYYYTLGMKKIRKYMKKNHIQFSFKRKPDYSGFPMYVRPMLALLYLIFVKKFVKK